MSQVPTYSTFLKVHQVAAILRVNCRPEQKQVKVQMEGTPTGTEFPSDPEVWLSEGQLDPDLREMLAEFLADPDNHLRISYIA